jgi:hypothetical protein
MIGVILLLLASLFLPALLGWLLALNLWPDAPATWPARLLRGVMGLGAGLAVSSLLTFLSILAAGPSTAFMFLAEVALAILLAGLLAARRISLRGEHWPRRPALGEVERVFLIGLGLVAVAALASMILATLREPHGHWDAWAIWNLHARFLYRGGPAWTNLFALQYSHPDYPLLLPTLVARAWFYVGRESQAAPALLSLLYALLTTGALVVGVAHGREPIQGAVAGALLLGTPFFIFQAAGQLADIPVSFYMLSALLCLDAAAETPLNRHGLAGLAGLCAGGAAWTKDEGLAVCLFLTLLCAAYAWRRRGPRAALIESGAFVVAALPFAATTLYLKFGLAPLGRLFLGQTPATVAGALIQPARYLQVIRAFFNGAWNFGDWFIPVGAILVGYLVLMGASPREGKRAAFTLAILLVGLMLAGYFFIYLVTPADLIWQLATSLDRLLLQLWPSLLLAYFLVVRQPALPWRKR